MGADLAAAAMPSAREASAGSRGDAGAAVAEPGAGGGGWWDGRLFGLWVLVNGVAFVVVPLLGVAVELLASSATKDLVEEHRVLVMILIAVVGASFQGAVVGRWQWRLLQRRGLESLARRRWVVATLIPAFFVWLFVVAPEAVDLLASGGDLLLVFRDGFIQALVLGPIIGLSQAFALRSSTTRWPWWFVANVTTYLSGAALHVAAVWLQDELSLRPEAITFCPVLAFAIHGLWMLWVTAPEARTDP